MSWFSSFFRRREPPARPGESGPPVPGEELLAEIGEGLRKLVRLQARQGVRLEQIENKLEGGFADLRAASQQAVHRIGAPLQWDELLDATDALDEAQRAASAAGDESMAEGLRAVGARIERFLAQQGVRREGHLGAAPDPALVRVIGTIEEAAMSEGHVARVVRAPVTERGRLLREGEVLVARSPRPPRSGEASP